MNELQQKVSHLQEDLARQQEAREREKDRLNELQEVAGEVGRLRGVHEELQRAKCTIEAQLARNREYIELNRTLNGRVADLQVNVEQLHSMAPGMMPGGVLGDVDSGRGDELALLTPTIRQPTTTPTRMNSLLGFYRSFKQESS